MSFYVRYALAAACGVIVLVAADVLIVHRLPSASQTTYVIALRIALYAAAALAAALAAAQFGWWSERIGRSWTLFSLEFVFLLVNYILRHAAPSAGQMLTITLIVANVAQIAAYWLMARVIAAAGIGHLVSTTNRVLLTVAALAVAVIICHAPLLGEWQALQQGNVPVGSLVSVLADVITFTLVAPLAMNSLALRGGQLSWIFGALTMSVFGWMLNEAATSIAPYLGGGDAVRMTRLAGIVIATLFNAAAAATQRHAARAAMKGAAVV